MSSNPSGPVTGCLSVVKLSCDHLFVSISSSPTRKLGKRTCLCKLHASDLALSAVCLSMRRSLGNVGVLDKIIGKPGPKRRTFSIALRKGIKGGDTRLLIRCLGTHGRRKMCVKIVTSLHHRNVHVGIFPRRPALMCHPFAIGGGGCVCLTSGKQVRTGLSLRSRRKAKLDFCAGQRSAVTGRSVAIRLSHVGLGRFQHVLPCVPSVRK